MNSRKAIYPGTFDPVTYGHIDLIKRGSRLFDELIVAVAENPRKNPLFSLADRVDMLQSSLNGFKNISIKSFTNLLVNFAEEENAGVIIKGLRAVSDFEYELSLSLANRRLAPDLETIFMMPSEEYSFVSSTIVREVGLHGGDIGSMAPPVVMKKLGKIAEERRRP